MTGAPIPGGADAVAMIEHVDRHDDSPATIRLLPSRILESGENIVPQGAEARAGEEVLPAGTRTWSAAHRPGRRLRPFGRRSVPPSARGHSHHGRRTRLRRGHTWPGPDPQFQRRHAGLAGVPSAGASRWILPTAADNDNALDEALRKAVSADMLLITGGVSAGKFDLVEPALARIGARFHFTGVRIQPGKPLVFGDLSRKRHSTSGESAGKVLPFFGLPGNPISSAATFLLFGSRILGALAGCQAGPRFALARLAKDVKGKPDLTRFVPSFCNFGPDGQEPPEVETVPSARLRRSNLLFALQLLSGRAGGHRASRSRLNGTHPAYSEEFHG